MRRFIILTLLCTATCGAETIDLATALRLGGANNVEIELARNTMRQAVAKHAETRNKLFPWFVVGTGYRRLDGNTQDTTGNISGVSKQSYQAGVGVVAEVRAGEAYYQTLAAKQRAVAAGHAIESARRDLDAGIASAYFDLLKAQAAMRVSEQSRSLAVDYEKQVSAAVTAGVAYEADRFRAQAQSLRHDLTTRKALEDVQLASARLAELLRLPSGLDLRGVDAELVPLDVAAPDASLSAHVGRALDRRPELRSRQAMLEAARLDAAASIKGPLVPDLSLRATTGGLGGGPNGRTGDFGDSSEFVLGLGWRFGPGGIFDKARTESTAALQEQESILLEKTRLRITREVLEATAKLRSIRSRLDTTRQLLEASEKTYQLSRDRGITGVGGILETLRAEEDLDFARLTWFELVAEYNKARAALRRATGD